MSMSVADLLNPSSSRASPTNFDDELHRAAGAAISEPGTANIDVTPESLPGLPATSADVNRAASHLPFPDNPYRPRSASPNRELPACGDAEDADDVSLKPLPQLNGHAGQDDGDLDPSLDKDTLKAIADAQNEYSTRRPTKREPSETGAMSPPPEAPKPTVPKKRAAPSKSNPSSKKKNDGTGGKRPPAKRRKVDGAERSLTPSKSSNQRKSSQSATPALGSSPAARFPSAPSEGGDSDASDDGTVYCICRKPDDHTWMIACDGDCDDWFHGKCINIRQEDGELIDKFICPTCAEKALGITTWKPMCRRDGCRKPARLKKGAASKYCSNECGVRFFRELAEKQSKTIVTPKKMTRKKKAEEDTIDYGADLDLGPLGGPIRPSELKALAYAADGAENFRRLGDSGVLTPPATASPDAERKPWFGDVTSSSFTEDNEALTEEERARLVAIASRKSLLRARRQLLKAREKFVAWAKERSAKQNAELKVKNLCGFDKRLSWSDAEFEQWMNSDSGKAAFEASCLEPVPAPTDPEAEAEDGPGIEKNFCMEKRCKKHPEWQRLALHDVRFEEADVGDEMRKIDREEQQIKELIAIRTKASALGGGLADEENTVESVEDQNSFSHPKMEGLAVSTEAGTPLGGHGDVVMANDSI